MSSFLRPHPPFDPPQSYYDLYKDKDLRAPAKGDWDDLAQTQKHHFEPNSIYGKDDDRVQHDVMAGYYACITHVDHQIGRILLALQEDGILEDTIVCFVSDHGEMGKAGESDDIR